MRYNHVRIISSACPICSYSDRKCEVLASTSGVIVSLMSGIDVSILEYLSRCDQCRDYIARISRGVDEPYMTVTRSLNKLIELRVVRVDDESSNEYKYHYLTPFGLELATMITRSRICDE